VGLNEIAREALIRHNAGFAERQTETHALDAGGQYQWRADGEVHLFSPQTVHRLQRAVRT
jgi:glutamate synthase domain-containing protein 2